MASIEEEERSLTALYAQRQELLKELTEVDNQIKSLENKQMQRQQTVQQQRQAILAVSTGDKDLDTIRGVIEKATHDQAGLREAQKAIEVACKPVERAEGESDEELVKRRRFRNLFIRQIISRSHELMVDPHGNYFVQRALSFFKNNGTVAPPDGEDYDVIEDTSISEVIALLDHLGTTIGDVSCNMHGTRAVQRVIDSLASVEEFELFCDLVANDLVTLIKDLNGNHSISRLLVSQSFMKLGEPESSAPPVDEKLREKGQSVRKDVYHIVASNCVEICRNRQGCCIIQRCLQWAPEPFRTEIINAALNNSLKLVQDPFGNYVVQYVLDLQQQLVQNNPKEAEALNYTNRIIRQILHNVALLSCNKFSSNVIEKCLKTASPDVRQLLIDELTDPHALPKLLTDSFANYVVQTAITTATDEQQFAQLRDAIVPLQHLLKNSPYGVKIEAKLMKRHRDSARKLSRQIRSQREGQQQSRPSGSQPPGAPQPPVHHQQHQDVYGFQGQQQQQQRAPPGFPPGMPPPQGMKHGGGDAAHHQLHGSQQPSNGTGYSGGPSHHQQQQQPSFPGVQFMVPPQQQAMLAGAVQYAQQHHQHHHHQHQHQHQQQQFMMPAPSPGAPHVGGHQHSSSWAVSSPGGYTAMQHQHHQQTTSSSSMSSSQGGPQGAKPGTPSPATHSPYTAYAAQSF